MSTIGIDLVGCIGISIILASVVHGLFSPLNGSLPRAHLLPLCES